MEYVEQGSDEQDVDIAEEFGMEDAKDKQEEVYDDVTPQFKEKDDLFSLFWKVVKTQDSSKVGNLNKVELGNLDISVRDCQKIASAARELGRIGFARFFEKQAEIVLATSSSKDGFLTNLFVSQRKFSTKSKSAVDNSANFQSSKKKKGLFTK